MKTGASVLLILFMVCSMQAQVVFDRVNVPDSARTPQVVAEREFYMLTPQGERLIHSKGDFQSWRILGIPRIWERYVPSYELMAFPGGEALLTFSEMNASKDTLMLGMLLWRDSPSRWIVDRCPAAERLPEGSNRLIYAGDSICFAEIPTGCLRSEDFGRTWTEVPALAGMRQLRFVGEGFGWAFRSTDTLSVIARTTDRGETWMHDTLRIELNGLMTEYDGRVLASYYDNLPSDHYYHFNSVNKRWRVVTFPFIRDSDGIVMRWKQLLTLSNGRLLALGTNDNLVTSFFLTEDDGVHWTRLQHSRELPSTEWKPIDRYISDLWRIGSSEFLFRQDNGVSLAKMTLPTPVPTTVTAENFSTMQRRQLLLRWSDPFGGDVQTVEIERSGADSSWTMIANFPIPVQEYLDSTWWSGDPVRYRVTLYAADGRTAHAASDSVTAMLGAYVDYLDYLLPSSDMVLRYRAVEFVRRVPPPVHYDTLLATVTLRFLTPRDSTSSMRIHPVSTVVDSANGMTDTTYGHIVEHRSLRHYFESYNVYPGLDYSMTLQGNSFFSEGLRHPGMMRANLLTPMAWMLPDSLDIFTQRFDPWNSWSCIFRAQEGVGVFSLDYRVSASGQVWTYLSWKLIDHVNATDHPPFPATALALSSYPNPLIDAATVRYDLPTTGEVTLTVHDMLGRRVATLADGRRSAGTHHASFRAAALPPGTYLLRLVADNGSITRLISLIR